MRPTRSLRSRSASVLLPLLLASCGDGGQADPTAQLHQLQLEIIQGKGIVDSVRAAGDPADAHTALPITVRVVADADYAVQAHPAGTGPALELRVPPVEVRWRTLQPWCRADRAASSVAGGDTASAFVGLPTIADACHVVASGVLNGSVFDEDTAVVVFHPGPVAGFTLQPMVILTVPFAQSVRDLDFEAEDAHGNDIFPAALTVELLSGAPAILMRNDSLIPAEEAVGRMRVSAAGSTQEAAVWALRWLQGKWRLEWACYGATLADGARADSARFVMDPVDGSPGGFSGRGAAMGFRGTLTTRVWVRGEPVRQTVVPASTRHAIQRPGVLEWSPGQVATRAGFAYTGGSLCEPLPGGGPWSGFAPVRAEQLG